jgi:hypothetical protein
MYGNKKNLILMLYFLHEYRISPIAIRLGSLEPIYTNYATRCVYVFMQYGTLRKNLFLVVCAQI